MKNPALSIAAWLLAGALLVFAMLAVLSIGWYVAPFGIALMVYAVLRGRRADAGTPSSVLPCLCCGLRGTTGRAPGTCVGPSKAARPARNCGIPGPG